MKCKKWEVWYAKVKYEDSDEVQERPVLIISVRGGAATALKMTSQSQRDDTDYPLKYWGFAGLDRETVVRTSKVLQLVDSDIDNRKGRLAAHDILQIQNIMLR
jgi:hypothetical protein